MHLNGPRVHLEVARMMRGEVWWVNFEPSLGVEIRKKIRKKPRKKRPALLTLSRCLNFLTKYYFQDKAIEQDVLPYCSEFEIVVQALLSIKHLHHLYVTTLPQRLLVPQMPDRRHSS